MFFDDFTTTVGLIVAVAIVIGIAFPRYLTPDLKPKKIKVGSAYWGVYQGQSTSQSEAVKTVEIKVGAEPKHRVVAGSQTYVAGRGNQ